MPSRRSDGEPRLVDRIRWGNLARLGAVAAAGLLIALGPRACSSAGSPALPPDTPAIAGPKEEPPPSAPAPAVRHERKPPHHMKKRHRRRKSARPTKPPRPVQRRRARPEQ